MFCFNNVSDFRAIQSHDRHLSWNKYEGRSISSRTVPLIKHIVNIKFDNNKDVQQHVLKLLHDADKDFYTVGFNRPVELWECCTKLKGEYVEK